MIKNYFLITFRSMMKNSLFVAINIFGMGVAIACCVVGYFAYDYDATFDAVHQNRETLYRVSAVREFEGSLTRFGYAALPLGNVVDKTFPDVEQSSCYLFSTSNFKRGDDLFASNLSYVDPDFFQMFSFDFIAGKASDLSDKSSVFISETMAVRLFRTPEDALGKTMTQVYGREEKEVKIAGVFREQPMNSSFYKNEGSAFMHADNYKDEFPTIREDDWRRESTLFVRVNNPSRVSTVHQQLQAYIANNNKVREDFQVKEFALDPFATMAHRDRAENVRAYTWAAPPQAAIVGSMIMSVLILLIACFNLTNTAIAISSRRLKEIGIRKVMGSMRAQLVFQFLGETTFICLLALVVGLGFADLLIAGWNLMTANHIHLEPHYFSSPGFLAFLFGVLFFTGLLAGSYPSLYISRFKPVTILKGKLKFGGTNYFTRTLLGLQFAISLITIVSAFGVLQNARYQQKYDLGFDVHGSVIATVNDQSEFDTYRDALQKNPEILSLAGARSGIFSNRAHEPVKYQSLQAEVDIIEVGDNYLNTLGLKLLEGRDFMKDSETDQRESIIITQRMANLFKWDKPLGKEIIWKDTLKLYVVGVVKDVYTQGLWREMEPMMIRYVLPAQYNQVVVSTKAEKVSSVNAYMREQWGKVFPNRLYNGYMLSAELEQTIALNMSIVYGYAFLGAIAMLFSATGLYTLVSLNMIRRMKEIGIRKIVGASVSSIMRTVNREFIIILTLASVVGSWAGFNWCNTIMSTIWKYYQGVNVWTFVISVGLLFVISIGTIGYKVFSVATMNPVKSLRDE
ncbi:ABC-type antimicrobial peptide transport system, permease component [Chryseolinea serpens]|uniref:ABC-type antimicrobial peptide transport system, permease component n=1 Tax=Chryseolinea serpens TaxID=947013 RepID=A0A1M5S0B9_9BACT|nr:ABC transporter permease [Chryseolinea serpens]SHH31503.1 ABC-type antimicrobial peptide transport system, permease component [Chryseolinea serpens]